MTSIIRVDSIKTAANGTATAASLGIGGTGKIGQVIQTTKIDLFSTNSTSYVDITGVTASITPTATSSKIFVMVNGSANMDDPGQQLYKIKLLRGTTALGISSGQIFESYSASTIVPQSFTTNILDTPNSTNQQVYKLQVLSSGNGDYVFIGGYNASAVKAPTTLTLMEVLA